MKLSKVLLFVMILIFSPGIFAEVCETHQACDANKSCACRIPAEWAFDRNYYFNLEHFNKGHVYQCQFHSSPSSFYALLAESKFPQGSQVACGGVNCPQFPLTLTIDTTNMIEDEDSASVKYFVPGSDIPNEVRVDCTMIDS
jgi:hypothetical protein